MIEIWSERKPKSFRNTGKVPGRVLRKLGKTEGSEKFRMVYITTIKRESVTVVVVMV